MSEEYYIKLYDRVMTIKGLSWGEKVVLSLIISLSDKKGYCFASSPYIAKRLNSDSGNVRRTIGGLTKKGLLKSETQYHEGTKKPKGQHITVLFDTADLPRHVDTAKPHGLPCQDDTANRVKTTRQYKNSDKSMDKPPIVPLGDESENLKEEAVGKAVQEPPPDSAPPPSAPEVKPVKPRSRLTKKEQERFDQFWKAWPRKTNKGQAVKAWISQLDIIPDDMNQLISAISREMKSKTWNDEGGRFIPHPSTWINAWGWENEVSVASDGMTISEEVWWGRTKKKGEVTVYYKSKPTAEGHKCEVVSDATVRKNRDDGTWKILGEYGK